MVKRIIDFLYSSPKKPSVSLWLQIPLYLFIASACILTLWYAHMNHSLFPTYEKKLWEIMITKETAINDFLNIQEDNANALATHPTTKNFLSTCNTHDSSEEDDMKAYKSFLAPQQETMGFKNILLINNNKIISFSTSKKVKEGTLLSDEAYKNSALSSSCIRAYMCLTTDFAEFAFDPLLDEPALFISVPVLKDKKLQGILVYEYDPQKIYSITNQYLNLKETGETALAQADDSFILFIAPTRHDPDIAFKKRNLRTKAPLSIQDSVLGGQGTGIAIDYRDVPVVAAWTFIPKVNWGMIVKIDQSEITQSLAHIRNILLLLFCIIILWFMLIQFIHSTSFINSIRSFNATPPLSYIPKILKHPFFLLMLLFLGLTLKIIIQYQYKSSSTTNKAKQSIADDIAKGAQEIEQILQKISFTTQSIADDLQSNRLKKADITKRVQRDLDENDNIISITIAFAPYAYDKTTRLYAPSIKKIKKNYEETTIEKLYDYTDTEESAIKTSWYQKTLQTGQLWLNPYTDNNNVLFPPTYSCIFYDKNKKPLGVVSTAYKLKAIARIAEYSSLNRIGYSILLSENGTFLFHPITSLMDTQTTLIQYAQEDGNEGLVAIAKKDLTKEPQLASYDASSTQQQIWIYTRPLAINNWILGAIFPEDDIVLKPHTIRHFYFKILFYFMLALISMCLFLYGQSIISPIHLTIITNIILIAALLVLWRIIQTTSTVDSKNSTIITDQASLDKFLDDLEEETNRKRETATIQIPCGLLLYSLDITRSDNMTIAGYLWNKYNITKHKNITRSMQLPHATSLTLGTPLISTSDNWETVTWNLRGSVYQKQHYEKFPFDRQELQITLEHYDIEKNIILTPDLEDYKKISHEDTPGLDKNFTLSGFNVEQTFFSYKAINPVTNFGLKEYGKTTDHYQLVYSLITTRSLMNPLLLFFLPLLGILFSIFCILLVAQKNSPPFSVLGPYTATFFSLILLQRVLRDQYPTTTTLYIEYAYFFTYFTIILLTIHTVLLYLYPNWDYYQNRIFPLIRLLFWPFQLVSWIITTLVVFY